MKIYIYILFFVMASCSHSTVFQKETIIRSDIEATKGLQKSVESIPITTKTKINTEKTENVQISVELTSTKTNINSYAEKITSNINGTKEITSKKFEYKISGPYTYRNLTVYLLHGENTINLKNVITLEEAMKNGKATVHETKIVGKLTIENLGNSPIYVHAGDILKGGKQDRTVARDVVVLPNSGRKAIKTFCVESGRWSKRNDESVETFHSNDYQVASKKLKLAIKYSQNQRKVWKQVKNLQQKLSGNLGESVRSNVSKSSMQLTLENKLIYDKVQNYIDALHDVAHNKSDSIGFVSAINGKISQVDIYGSHDLFLKLWRKLLHSSSVEALSEKSVAHEVPDILAVNNWLQKMRSGKRKRVKTDTNTQLLYQSKDSIGEDLFYGDDSDDLLHSSFCDFGDDDESLINEESENDEDYDDIWSDDEDYEDDEDDEDDEYYEDEDDEDDEYYEDEDDEDDEYIDG
ncbi:ARPP-1 family domain-containing protein [Candidatus Uabimicrobium sp. HlEnr_7]|uniref:ARPP-1 family domain-containing protein n=1 Tax=Candidatus Uabimicrobium helgolandensis TaxID=3095367 RepID=UPI0035577402